jgi:hypothetical protein
MLDPEKDQLVLDAPMYDLVEEFVCLLCKYIVAPWPQECPSCNKLFCKECIAKRGYWQCPN